MTLLLTAFCPTPQLSDSPSHSPFPPAYPSPLPSPWILPRRVEGWVPLVGVQINPIGHPPPGWPDSLARMVPEPGSLCSPSAVSS